MTAATSTMSSAVQPRERSAAGRDNPWRNGPSASAPASRCVSLYPMFPAERFGKTRTFARPATGLPGAFPAPIAGTIAASSWSSPSQARPGALARRSSVARATLAASGWVALPFVEKDSSATRGVRSVSAEALRGAPGDVAQLLGVGVGDQRAVGERQHVVPRRGRLAQRHQEERRDQRHVRRRAHHLQGRAERVGGRVRSTGDRPGDEPGTEHPVGEVDRIGQPRGRLLRGRLRPLDRLGDRVGDECCVLRCRGVLDRDPVEVGRRGPGGREHLRARADEDGDRDPLAGEAAGCRQRAWVRGLGERDPRGALAGAREKRGEEGMRHPATPPPRAFRRRRALREPRGRTGSSPTPSRRSAA